MCLSYHHSLSRLFAGLYDCTFENGVCGYHNVEESEERDDFDWLLRIGGTPSGKTGPKTDHTTGRFGNFRLSRLTFSHIIFVSLYRLLEPGWFSKNTSLRWFRSFRLRRPKYSQNNLFIDTGHLYQHGLSLGNPNANLYNLWLAVDKAKRKTIDTHVQTCVSLGIYFDSVGEDSPDS